MPAPQKPPFSVAGSSALVRLAAMLVPLAQRADWQREWLAEIWHRWQFLYHARAWNRWEALRLTRSCLGAFIDAAWLLISQKNAWNRLRGWARSPRTCLGGLVTVLVLLAILTSGFPATRQLLRSGWRRDAARLLFIWRHPVMTGGDRGLPPDVVAAWASDSRSL